MTFVCVSGIHYREASGCRGEREEEEVVEMVVVMAVAVVEERCRVTVVVGLVHWWWKTAQSVVTRGTLALHGGL